MIMPIFHAPVILPSAFKIICCMNMIANVRVYNLITICMK